MILNNFIVFEGIDGAGTTTQCDLIKKDIPCNTALKNISLCAEPTKSVLGQFLRKVLQGHEKITAQALCYLFAADRAQHLYSKGGIVDLCNKGQKVICDRYLFSSLAYQAVDCTLDLPKLINSPFPLPEVLFFFDIDPKISLERIQSRGKTEIFEKYDFLKKTVVFYKQVLDLYKTSGIKIITLDATCSPLELHKEILYYCNLL